MASSLIGGIITDGCDPGNIWVSDPNEEQRNRLTGLFNIHITASNVEAAEHADVVILAVKPQVIKTVAQELASIIQQRAPLIISIAAGVREADLDHWLGGNLAIVRAMPNTPALLSCGATALHANSNVSDTSRSLAESLMRAVGLTVWLNNEKLMDAATALSGSGPAYFFLVMEAMEQAGRQLGLSDDIARLLTMQTAFGAAKMALESDVDIATLRARVTSKGGTTERALAVLEDNKIRDIFSKALEAANSRAKELADILGNNNG